MKKIISFIGEAFLITLVSAIALLNFFSGIIAGIWLAILGHWSLIGKGILLGIGMPYGYMIVTLPTMLLIPLIMYFNKKGNRVLVSIISFINILYDNGIMIFWVFFVFIYFIAEATPTNFIPLLLWGYSTTLSPLGYMAKQEPPGSIATTIGMFLAIVSYIALVVMWFTVGTNFIVLVILAVIFSVLNLALGIAMMKNEA